MTKPLAFIIEDEPDLNLIFGISFKEAGFDIESFHNGAEALARMTSTIPDVVTLDLHLPDISGQEILKEIRTHADLKNICVILTTADHHLASSLEHHVDFTLIKPISYNQLRNIAIQLKP